MLTEINFEHLEAMPAIILCVEKAVSSYIDRLYREVITRAPEHLSYHSSIETSLRVEVTVQLKEYTGQAEPFRFKVFQLFGLDDFERCSFEEWFWRRKTGAVSNCPCVSVNYLTAEISSFQSWHIVWRQSHIGSLTQRYCHILCSPSTFLLDMLATHTPLVYYANNSRCFIKFPNEHFVML